MSRFEVAMFFIEQYQPSQESGQWQVGLLFMLKLHVANSETLGRLLLLCIKLITIHFYNANNVKVTFFLYM